MTRGEPRIRPSAPTPVPVPPACAGLPDRDTEPTAPPQLGTACALPRCVQWRLTCTGLWTERRTCPRAWRALLGRLREECVRLAHADDVPLLGIQRAPVVAGAAACMGTSPVRVKPDRPRLTFRRRPAKAASVWWVRVPSTVATTERERIAPHACRVGLPLTPPTRSPHGWGQSALDGHCKGRSRVEP